MEKDDFTERHELIENNDFIESDDFINSLAKRFVEVLRVFFSRSYTQIDLHFVNT